MSKKEKKKVNTAPAEEIHLDIPEDEIWTYQIEGLAAPHINKPYKNYGLKKAVFVITILIAIALSMYFSIRTVSQDTFAYEDKNGAYTLSKFSNTGYIKELDIDYVSTLEYVENNSDPNTNFVIVKDETRPVTAIREYALNCDGYVKVINIGANVLEIDGKSFYSCWALQRIEVDENNPNYCDIDGVLYSKDMTELICVPCDHDAYRAEISGYAVYDGNGNLVEPGESGYAYNDGSKDVTVEFSEGQSYEDYVNKVLTYVIPSSVKTVGELAFNYANMATVYLPEGLTTIETLGFYEIPKLANIYSYKTDAEITDTRFTSQEDLGEVYLSLPEGLEYIGSDAFTECQALSYMYIPESVNHIGHHAFWATCYIDKAADALGGLAKIDVALSEGDFSDKVTVGDQWKPQYDSGLFNKYIDIIYSAERQAID